MRFSVYGRVQGVGFRAYSRRIALAASVQGWARNCDDGSVDILIAGEAQAVAAARRQIIAGPAGARVDRVADTAAPATCELNGFTIG